MSSEDIASEIFQPGSSLESDSSNFLSNQYRENLRGYRRQDQNRELISVKSGTNSELLRKPATFSLAEIFGHSVVEEKEKIKKKISVCLRSPTLSID